MIKKYCIEFSLDENRCVYVHDLHLPTLLRFARGVVVLNSTAGIQALHHERPLKVCGKAFYNLEDLCFQGSLEEFWGESVNFKVNKLFYRNFINYIIRQTQFNGSFYKRLSGVVSRSGIKWY